MPVEQPSPADGRTARRLLGMRRLQATAFDLFEQRGFDAVTIEEVARAAGLSPPTVYRGFGTKERLVLWDETESSVLPAIRARLPAADVVRAVEAGLVDGLEQRHQQDRQHLLRRARLVERTARLRQAAAAEHLAFVEGLTAVLHASRAYPGRFSARVVAGALAGLLHAAEDEWLRRQGRTSFAAVLREAFAHLGGPRSARR